MAITFEFEQDFRKYRDYISYITKVDEVIGLLPFLYYQGDMLSCYVIEKKGDVVTVILSNNTAVLKERFIETAQPDTFDGIQENVAFMYDLKRHELIYNYDTKEPSTALNWSTYPEVFWMKEEDRYDHGLMLGKDNKLYRMYLSNKKMTAMLVSISELNNSFPTLFSAGTTEVTLRAAGVEAVLSILACQLGQDEPKISDIRMAIACDLIQPDGQDYPKYNFESLIELFELKGNKDDVWDDTWGAAMDTAISSDTERDLLATGNLTSDIDGNRDFQLCLSEMASLEEVPETDRPIYVHMDIPIHGVHYMMVEADQTLCVFFDNLIIREEDILQHLENLPQNQISFHCDYEQVGDDELAAMDKSGIASQNLEAMFDALDDSQDPADSSDLTLGQTGGI